MLSEPLNDIFKISTTSTAISFDTDMKKLTIDENLKNSMLESIILPSDRDTDSYINSKDTDSTLYASYLESGSLISSCMLTSESFYGYEESKLKEDHLFGGVHGKDTNMSEDKFHASEDSMGYKEQLQANLKTKEKTVGNFFKICFDTDISDEDEIDVSILNGIADISSLKFKEESPSIPTDFHNPLLQNRSQNILDDICEADYLVGHMCEQFLQSLTVMRLRSIANDLLMHIQSKNRDLLSLLPEREDLLLENENNQMNFGRLINFQRPKVLRCLSGRNSQH